MSPTVFTRIINREIPAYIIYEDDEHIAFLDVHPVNDGHTLVVPKKEVSDYLYMNEDEYLKLFNKARKIAGMLKQKINSPRVGLVVEGFGVPHVHVHLIPVYHGDDLKKPQDMTTEIDNPKLKRMQELLTS
jgi:histidine triad (HIT) family protein